MSIATVRQTQSGHVARAKLGYLISRYPSISHTFILREVRELRRLGLQIEVASINGPDRNRSELTAEESAEAQRTFYVKAAGIGGVLRAHTATLLRSPLVYFSGLAYALRLGGADLRKLLMCVFYFVEAVMVGEWMRSSALRCLHVHFGTPVATVGLIAARMFPLSFSLTVHGPDEFFDAPGNLLEQKFAAADLICAIGTFAQSQVMKLSGPEHWRKIEVVPLGVDAGVFLPPDSGPGEEIAGDNFEVLCVGRLVPAKGQHVLLAAVAQLRRKGRRVSLRLVGDGPDRDSLGAAAKRWRVEDAVIFEGAVNQDRIHAFYARADLFAMASFAEGIPVVLMEAMAMEIPCVATWIAGIPELIRDSIDGLLVAPSDADGLAEAIGRLMDDEVLRRRLGAAGRQRVMDKYDLRRNAARLAEVFDAHLAAANVELAL